MSTFNGGAHPREMKTLSSKAIEKLPLSKRYIVPLQQHTGAAAIPAVQAGDLVKTGQLIASASGFISANIHSPISGKVAAIEKMPHPCGSLSEAIVIDSDGLDEQAGFTGSPAAELSPSAIVEIIRNSGIVGLGGAAFPTHVKLSPPKEKIIDSVIINCCECEPYLTCDHRTMLESAEEIFKGLELIMKVLDVKNAFLAVEDNKKDTAATLEKFVSGVPGAKIVFLRTKYPQGAEKQLIKAVLAREVPSGGLPMDVGCVVHNVQTVKAVYEAVYFGKPLFERAITVAGEVKNPGNFLARTGTPVTDIINHCGGLTEDAAKIIIGGPMMGVSQSSLDVPVLKGTSGIVVLGKKAAVACEPSNCIRCGRCVDACPSGLVPTMISRLVEKERYDDLGGYSPADCIECGCCAFECPSGIRLVQNIKLAKLINGRKA
jgi:electron transport complex protein RnfC